MAVKKDVEILPLEFETTQFTIIGRSPLIVHAWNEKARKQILDPQTGEPKIKKHDKRVPFNDFVSSLNWLTPMPELCETEEETKKKYEAAIKKGAAFGFDIGGIKKSIIRGAARLGMPIVQTELKGTFFLFGAGKHSTFQFAEIISPNPPKMREDFVKIGGISKTTDIRFRAQFDIWEIPLILKINKNAKYSLKQIVNLINAGGFACGLGEWRPERDGQFGMYELKQ